MLVEDWLMDLLKIAEDYKRLLRSMKSGSLPSCSTECPPWAGLCTPTGREPVVKVAQAAKILKTTLKQKNGLCTPAGEKQSKGKKRQKN